MDDVVVDELSGRCVPCDDARAESGGQPGHEGGGDRYPHARDGSPLLNHRRAVPDEPVPSPRNRLDEVRVGTEGDANVPDGEVDALVVRDVGVWPQCRADLL